MRWTLNISFWEIELHHSEHEFQLCHRTKSKWIELANHRDADKPMSQSGCIENRRKGRQKEYEQVICSCLWLDQNVARVWFFLSQSLSEEFLTTISNDNRTEWSPIRSVIKRMINKIRRTTAKQESDLLNKSIWLQTELVLVPINHNYFTFQGS